MGTRGDPSRCREVALASALAALLLGAAVLASGCADDTPEAVGPSTTLTPSSTSTTLTPSGTSATQAPDGETARVVEVIDGDTLDVRLPDGRQERVRLIGVNTPERGECLSDEATDRLTQLVGGAPIQMTADRTDRDDYGRLLRYLYADGVFLNESMVSDGLAIARRYGPDTAQARRLESAQRDAQRSGLGQWADDACGAPQADGSGVGIGALQADAPGNDDNNSLNGEWVEVGNRGTATAKLGGWVLKDTSASHRFEFPAGFSLKPGSTVRISSGCGTDSDHRLYWCLKGSAVWNNDADTAYLLDRSGNIVDSHAYG